MKLHNLRKISTYKDHRVIGKITLILEKRFHLIFANIFQINRSHLPHRFEVSQTQYHMGSNNYRQSYSGHTAGLFMIIPDGAIRTLPLCSA